MGMGGPRHPAFRARAPRPSRATFATMLSSQSFFFAYFWFSHRTGGGEASA